MLNCEGTCQLRKAFEKLDQQKKEQQVPKQAKSEVLICQDLNGIALEIKPVIFHSYSHPANDPSALASYQIDILKPPMFLA
ncbi:hypothetical protein EIM50_18375 [Pseudoxanthomonas sp. SGD-10]|nr:hypothetical protein EIM50_18375 [Pseudoxanthomonas sp. SGD-10]